ncbi:D-amino-acid dehydrogenase [Phyllobacterium sp. YR620]|uniref:NAD(P)/FAD-dependent oxidoreductase n=1 Tax=Phyllobacterium sp. YR620 TaxID=1881066 RepID=UPI0008902AF6|nr:FAD-dependent oxidoreductase [Phyllobacterium sp. YR620]SDP28175.1 D-amino-acid dehydrogenase [Phyllobacterium sp. YR620]
MSERKSVEIAIIGAGVIGLSIALRLASQGREVVLIDPNEPGSGASFGNAGTFADYACVPVGNPDILKNLPQLLLNADSPFSLRWAALFQLSPWLIQFVRESLPRAARANAIALAGILSEALPAWEELAVEAHAEPLMRRNGCLYLQQNRGNRSTGSWAHKIRCDLGMRQETLSAEEVAAMEPTLPRFEGSGIFFPESMNVTDPSALMEKLLAAGRSKGMGVQRSRVAKLKIDGDWTLLSGPNLQLRAKTAVIATGAFSRDLAFQAGDRIPLETERGYHLEYATESPLLQRPVCPTHLGFYMTPMAGRLRVAGTVELGGTRAGPNQSRFELLDRGVRQYYPNLEQASSKWLGFRPSLPDSRPVIGWSRHSRNVIYAFGHGHLGLTLAAITSRLVATLVKGDMDPLTTGFTPDRFLS